MLLEICASNYKSAINAEKSGAHRIELCQELAVGGVTPSYGLLKQVVNDLSIPVFVLIRPRSGNFTYSVKEFEIMKKDIILCKEMGVSGIVSGVLNSNNSLDEKRTKELVELSKPLSFTFHRAFDWVPNPTETLKKLSFIGVDRILTSGQQVSAIKGIDLLEKLKKLANNKVTILPGGGINANNIEEFKKLSFREVHASATTINKVNSVTKINMNSAKFMDDSIAYYSNKETIKKLLNIINS